MRGCAAAAVHRAWRRAQPPRVGVAPARLRGALRGAPPSAVRGESTPFYLADTNAHRRMRDVIPEARIIAVLRDPVDRAYSNWMHLWADGLEPESDILAACDAEEARIAGGWAPFWRYRGLGRYGEQLRVPLLDLPREQVMVLRYRELVDEPVRVLDDVCRFLGVDTGVVTSIPRDNSRPFVKHGPRRVVLSRVMRAGAGAGAFFSPSCGGGPPGRCCGRCTSASRRDRPQLTAIQRQRILAPLLPDLELLESVTGRTSPTGAPTPARGRSPRGRSSPPPTPAPSASARMAAGASTVLSLGTSDTA